MLENLWMAIEATPFSTAVRETSGVFPMVESVHVLALTFVVGSIAVVDLRLLNLAAREARVTRLSSDLLPWTWGAFGLAALTGVVMFIAGATVYGANPAFLIKLVLLAVAGANMLAFHYLTWRNVHVWDLGPPPTAARIAGALSLTLWVAIVVVGRWVGFL